MDPADTILFEVPVWNSYDESTEILANQEHEIGRMQYKLIQSKWLDKNKIWEALVPELQQFSEAEYDSLKPYILEQDIPSIQQNVREGKLTYEQLVLWYLHRIVKYESDPEKTLHSIIALNPRVVEEARQRDQQKAIDDHLIYGMPILLKDNVNTAVMKTTAGAAILQDNQTHDAFIVERLKEKGALILGKANLSEWAYFFCRGCPVGYSAIGGQTLNPYGRKIFETGGSSSGSGTTIAANYAVGAVGTETSGSILSPSSKNALVGLKPTIGLLSRSGIVPISSTLDTPGPMTRTVTDNAILLSALSGRDPADPKSGGHADYKNYFDEIDGIDLTEMRLGVNKRFLERDSLYALQIEALRTAGAAIIEFDPPDISLDGFGDLLAGDMRFDLADYLQNHTGEAVQVSSVQQVLDFNLQDTLLRAPYGQERLIGAAESTLSRDSLHLLDSVLQVQSRLYFAVMDEHNLDAVLSINNYNAGMAAAAKYPCLTIPMGFSSEGEPSGLTFIGKPFSEAHLLKLGYQYEQLTKARRMPEGYR